MSYIEAMYKFESLEKCWRKMDDREEYLPPKVDEEHRKIRTGNEMEERKSL